MHRPIQFLVCQACARVGMRDRQVNTSVYARTGSSGDWSDEVTPGPIPNPVVKLASADGSTWATACKSRSLPEGPVLPPPFTPILHFKSPYPLLQFAVISNQRLRQGISVESWHREPGMVLAGRGCEPGARCSTLAALETREERSRVGSQ